MIIPVKVIILKINITIISLDPEKFSASHGKGTSMSAEVIAKLGQQGSIPRHSVANTRIPQLTSALFDLGLELRDVDP